jgi:protocatechuate 4,5-dioxygenase beta chain
MATIVGGIGTTHVPSIGKAIAEGKQGDPYWKPFFRGFDYVHDWLARTKPDVAVVFYNDHGLNFFLDKLPTFAVGASAEYRSEDEGWGIPVSRPVPGDADLSWHLINTLVADEFDVTMCQDMLIDHAVTIPMALMWPSAASSDRPWPVKIVPVEINTVQHPLPSMARCLKLGRSIGRALETYPRDLRVAVVGTGGLSVRAQASSTRISTRFVSTRSSPSRRRSPAIRSMSWWNCRDRRAWSFSIGWRCAVP